MQSPNFHHVHYSVVVWSRKVNVAISGGWVGKQMNDAEFLGCVYEVVRIKHWAGLPSVPPSPHSSAQLHTTPDREYRVTMAEELRNLPIQGDYVTPPP